VTVNDIQREMRAAGSHWWDPDALRFFKSRVESPVYQGPGGVYFVSSEEGPDEVRRYTVRRYNPAERDLHSEDAAGGFQAFGSSEDAMAAAQKLAAAGGEATLSVVAHRPVTEAEQLAHDIAAHTGREPSGEKVAALVAAARRVHRIREDQCNGVNQCDHERHEAEPDDCPGCEGTGVSGAALALNAARRAARRVGAEAILKGDPRGCCFLLRLPDGFTNDWGRDGYCVPLMRGDS